MKRLRTTPVMLVSNYADAQDMTTGAGTDGTDGTGNTWTQNHGKTSNPPGLVS